jgi:hypothetical protein
LRDSLSTAQTILQRLGQPKGRLMRIIY